MLKKCLCAAVVFMYLQAVDSQAQVRAEKAIVDNKAVFILENEHLRVTIDPATGRATDLTFKRLPAGGNMASKFGLFGEVAPGFGGSWAGRVAAEGPDCAVIELTQTGSRPPQWHLKLVKTISLERGSTAVKVGYSAVNKGSDPSKLALRVHNGIIFPGGVEGLDGLKSENSWFYLPSAQGVRSMADPQKMPQGEKPTSGDFVEVEPAAGWSAGRGESGAAFAATMDWHTLDACLDWCDKFSGATVEWACTEVSLKPGDQFQTGYTFALFTGMSAIYGASEDRVIGMRLPEPLKAGGKITVQVALASSRALKGVKVTLETAILPDEKGKPAGEKVLDLAAGEAANASFEVDLADNATHTLTAVATADGKEIARGVCVVPLGKTTRGYLAKMPEGGKKGDSYWGARFRRLFNESDTSMPDHYRRMDLETVTPHVKWLKPNALGSASVMFITRPDYFKYSVRELYQRFDIKPDFSFIFQKKRAGVFMLDAYREDVVAELERTIERGAYDVLYFCNVNWNGLPEDFKTKLLDRVNKGLGIVMAGDSKSAAPLLEALKARKTDKAEGDKVLAELGEALQVAAGEKMAQKTDDAKLLLESVTPPTSLGLRFHGLETYKFGKGRAVFMNYQVFSMYDSFLPSAEISPYPPNPWWEHVYALYGRAILWAAGKDSGVVVTPAEMTAAGASAKISGPAADKVKTVRFTAVDDDLAEIARMEIRAANNAVSGAWPKPLANGRYIVGMVALDEAGKALGFAGRTIQLEAAVKVDIQLDNAYVRGTERPKAEVSLSAPEPVKGRVEARLTDSAGRIVYMKSDEVQTGGAALKYDLKNIHPLTVGHTFTADFFQDGARVATASRPVRFWPERSRFEDDFGGAIWGTVMQGPYAQAILRTAQECGIERLYVGPTTVASWPALTMGVNMGFDFYMLNINEIDDLFTYDTPTETFNPSPWDESVFAAAAKRAREWAEKCRELAVDHYIMRDEYHLRWPGKDLTKDNTPQTMAAFREFLKKDYADIKALNAEWDTDFADWGGVARPDQKNVPAWNDWQAFWDTYMVKHMAVTRKAIAEINPRVKIGMSGCQRPGDGKGWDWWLLMKEAEYFHRYNHFQDDWINSFGSGKVIQGQWFGYSASKEVEAQYDIWSNLLTGSHLVSYFKLMLGTAPNQDMAVASHDLRLRPYYTFVAQEMPKVKNGLGRQILACAHQYDPIAMYHSQRSNLAGGGTLNATYAFKRLIEDSGFRFITIDSRDVLAGALATRGIKALFLPQVLCVSDAERDVLAKFVEDGGTLITDQNTGMRDGHGKPRPGGGVLDQLFGIARQAKDMTGNTAGKFSATADACAQLKDYSALQVAAAGKGITPATAKAWLKSEEGTPAVMVNKAGKGQAVYLNLDLANYASSAAGGVGGEVTEDTQGVIEYTSSCVNLMRGLLAGTAGLSPRASVWSGGHPLSDTRVYYMNRGSLDLVCFLMGKNGSKADATVKLPRKAHVYELRSSPRYFGETAEVQAAILPGIGSVFALLPYEVDRVELTAPGAAKPGELIKVSGKIIPKGEAKAAFHVARLEIAGPGGKPLACFAANLDAEGGAFERELPLALNDPAGEWTITVTDIISRKSASAVLKVGP